jgi:hypothetical protein
MQLAYRLDRRVEAAPATGLLLLSHEAADVVALYAGLEHDPPPRTFLIADGFLLLLETATAKPWPRTVKLRQLAEHLLVPVDAELSPQLHDDEAIGLTRDRGLVFLPGGRVLEYTPGSPLEMSTLLAASPVVRNDLSPLPPARRFAEHLSIALDLPIGGPEDVVEPGGEGIGTEELKPEERGPFSTGGYRASMKMGQIVAKLGKALGLERMRQAGENIARRAAEAAPELAAGLYGAQGAALRELLKLFRSGDVEKALRRAIPKGDDPGYRGRGPGGANLPWHSLSYSLGNILGGGGGGPVNLWMGHDEIVEQIFREYRRAAEDASNRGDFRRAAFIYGKLLSDWRAAADVLARGGLHRDAAILYRDRLQDHLCAAGQFEAAGEFDAALAIYEKRDCYELAGDLLLRLGEEEKAHVRYRKAAEEMMRTGRGALRAGEFMLAKTGRDDLAEIYFAAGWDMRKSTTTFGDVVPCGTHLARIFAKREKAEPFLNLLGEAESHFNAPGNTVAAGQMFNEFASLSSRPQLEGWRDEVRDRCLLALAGKLREHAAAEERPGTIVSTLLGTSGVWDAPVVRDAAVALKASLRPTTNTSELTGSIVSLGGGTITAARVAPHTGEVFAGFDDGSVVCFRASANKLLHVGRCRGEVAALATTMGGDLVVAACMVGDDFDGNEVVLRAFHRAVGAEFKPAGQRSLEGSSPTGLAPLIAAYYGDSFTLVRSGPALDDVSILRGADLLPARTGVHEENDDWPIDLPLPKEVPGVAGTPFVVLQKGGLRLCSFVHAGQSPVFAATTDAASVDWFPQRPPGTTLLKAPVTWHQHAPERLELAGLNDEGALYWLDLRLSKSGIAAEKVLATGCREGYRAVKLVRPGVMAGLTAHGRLIWLRASGDRLAEWRPPQQLISPVPPVAAFYCQPTQELLVLLNSGLLVRTPIPS